MDLSTLLATPADQITRADAVAYRDHARTALPDQVTLTVPLGDPAVDTTVPLTLVYYEENPGYELRRPVTVNGARQEFFVGVYGTYVAALRGVHRGGNAALTEAVEKAWRNLPRHATVRRALRHFSAALDVVQYVQLATHVRHDRTPGGIRSMALDRLTEALCVLAGTSPHLPDEQAQLAATLLPDWSAGPLELLETLTVATHAGGPR